MKRVLTLTLAVAMLLTLLAACGGSGGGGAATTAAAATEAATTTAAATTAAATTAEATTTATTAAEPDTSRMLTITANRFAEHVDWDQMYIWQKFEEDTGIKVTWDYVDASAIIEQRNLRVATNSLTDAFYGGRWTPAEIAQYTQEGHFIPIDGYLNATYAPNTTKFYEEYPFVKQALYLFDGHIYGWPIVTLEKAPSAAFMVREEWMNDQGLALPTTTDELLDLMIKMKEPDPSRLVYTSYDGQIAYGDLLRCLMGCWGLGNRGAAVDFWDADPSDWSKVRFIPTTSEFKEMLTLVNKMYAAGCIVPDAMTQPETAWGAKTAQTNPSIIGVSTNDVLEVYMCEQDYIGVGPLTGPHGDNMHSAVNIQTNRQWNYVITKNCKNIETAVEFADYWMSEEASILFFRGAEGIHWEWNEDHTRRVAMDWLTNDPGGRSEDQMRSTWTSQPGGSYFGYNLPQPPDLSYNYVKACEDLKPYLPEICWPMFSFTADETSITTTVGIDVTAYYQESVVSFISGRLSLDNDWDTYVKRYDDMGLSSLREAYQAAYDRYLASGGELN